MSNCRACTAEITWAINDETGERVPLDDREQRDWGPDRFRIIMDGNPPRVQAVSEESPRRTFVDHRKICQEPRVIQ